MPFNFVRRKIKTYFVKPTSETNLQENGLDSKPKHRCLQMKNECQFDYRITFVRFLRKKGRYCIQILIFKFTFPLINVSI